jgi:hypothetical protein
MPQENKRNSLPPEPTPTLGPEHQQMEVFVGKWNSEGWAVGDGRDNRMQMAHRHTYQWLPGGFFLVHHWDGRIGDKDNRGIEIIGYDPSTGAYSAHFFDNGGWARMYRAYVRDRTWAFAGQRERATVVVSEDGNTMMWTWEQTKDGSSWLPLCEVRSTRAKYGTTA